MINKRKIARIIRNSKLGSSKLYLLFRYLFKKNNAIKAIHRFVQEPISNQDQKHILNDMKYAMVNYQWEFDEFFLYNFKKLTHQERKSFVCEFEKNIFCDQVNEDSCQEIFDNKWKTFKKFRKFYKRDAVLVLPDNDSIEIGCNFLSKYKICILKPIISSLGKGIRKVETTLENSILLKELLKEYSNGFVLEELINQSEDLSLLHPQSVNTLRVHTILTEGGEVIVFKPYLRMGRGASIVDNAGSGGIFTSVDFESGIITKAVDESGNSYYEHPDTKVNLIGFKIPKWREAIELSKNLAMIVPQNRYTGWDLALTNDGWVMVEGNTRAQFVFQIPEQCGFRKEFNSLKDQIK